MQQSLHWLGRIPHQQILSVCTKLAGKESPICMMLEAGDVANPQVDWVVVPYAGGREPE